MKKSTIQQPHISLDAMCRFLYVVMKFKLWVALHYGGQVISQEFKPKTWLFEDLCTLWTLKLSHGHLRALIGYRTRPRTTLVTVKKKCQRDHEGLGPQNTILKS